MGTSVSDSWGRDGLGFRRSGSALTVRNAAGLTLRLCCAISEGTQQDECMALFPVGGSF